MFDSFWSTVRKITALVAVPFLLFLPTVTSAQSPFVPCDGTGPNSCNACHFVQMGNTVLLWLIGILFVIFAVALFLAGWAFVTSGGSPDAKTDAKNKLVNAVIGMLIVLAAWIIVDTIMKALLPTDGSGNATISQVGGSQFGPWNRIRCAQQPQATYQTFESYGNVTSGVPVNCSTPAACATAEANCTSGGGTPVTTGSPPDFTVTCNYPVGIADSATTRAVCDVGPSGDRVLCTAQVSACEATGGEAVIDSSDPTQYYVDCVADTPGSACDTSRMSSVNLFGFNTTVDNSIVAKVNAINSEWQSRGGNSFYRVYSVGAYNCRRVTGGSGYSVHAYGLAIDINPSDNPYVKPKPGGGCPTNMPASFVSMFTSRGFGWGGNWNSLCDAMHMSDASKEGGSQSI